MHAKKKPNFKFKIFISVVITLFLLYIIHVIYLYATKDRIIDPILNIEPSNVVSFVISPRRGMNDEFTLSKSVIKIHDKKTVANICNALNSAEASSTSHPGIKWDCLLTINTRDQAHSCIIYNTIRQGLLIFFYSDGGSGFNFGEYRSDSLAPILELVVKEINSKNGATVRNFKSK